jgi:presenilin-like A22 family membrane protease
MYYAVAVTSEVVYLIGALALFNLRARAVPLFALALAFSVADMLVLRSEGWGALPDDAPGAEPGQQLATVVGSTIGLLVFVATLAYAARLRRRGVLR